MPECRDDAGLLSCNDVTRGRARNQSTNWTKVLSIAIILEFSLDGTSIAGSEAGFGVKVRAIKD